MFEFMMVLCFAYAGFCYLLPEDDAKDGEEEGEARRRRDAQPRDERRRPGGRPAAEKAGGLSLLRTSRRRGEPPGPACGCAAAGRSRWRYQR